MTVLNFNAVASKELFGRTKGLTVIRHGDHLLVQANPKGLKTAPQDKTGNRRKLALDAETAAKLGIEEKTRYAVEPFDPKSWVKKARWARQLEGSWYRLVRHSNVADTPRVNGNAPMVTVGA